MTSGIDLAQKETQSDTPDYFAPRDEEGRLAPEFVKNVSTTIKQGAFEALADEILVLPPADLGDLVGALKQKRRLQLIRGLGDQFDFEALTEVDDAVRAEILEELSTAEVAEGVKALENDDAVYILEDLQGDDRDDILARLPDFDRLTLKRSLDFPLESAGRRMRSTFVAIPPFWTVGQTIDYLREDQNLPESFFQIYVVDATYHLKGFMPLDRLLRAKRSTEIADLLTPEMVLINAEEDQETAARQFERYDLIETAVIDADHRLLGVLTVDDIVDVIEEEASEDIKKLAGVGDEEFSDRVTGAVRSRFTWLAVNLATSVVASIIIGLFDATIEQMVALAVLMPIVASMGGNAGTQTMTIVVRAIALSEMDALSARRVFNREVMVGLINGVIFALLVGVVTWIWFGSAQLGGVIGAAMIVNMLAAGIAGVLIPVSLNALKIDPAVASTAFVTTVTDVVGFFAFLGLAALWFGLI